MLYFLKLKHNEKPENCFKNFYKMFCSQDGMGLNQSNLLVVFQICKIIMCVFSYKLNSNPG